MTSAWYAMHIPEEDSPGYPILTPTSSDLKGWDEWDFQRGKPIESWDSSVSFRVVEPKYEGELVDVLPSHLYLEIFSPRLRSALVEVGIQGIQYLPIRLYRLDGSEAEGYCIANVTNLIAALDMVKSSYTLHGENPTQRRGQIRMLRKPVLRSAAVEGHDILRLAEKPTRLFVSEKFRQVFQAGRFYGRDFEPMTVS